MDADQYVFWFRRVLNRLRRRKQQQIWTSEGNYYCRINRNMKWVFVTLYNAVASLQAQNGSLETVADNFYRSILLLCQYKKKKKLKKYFFLKFYLRKGDLSVVQCNMLTDTVNAILFLPLKVIFAEKQWYFCGTNAAQCVMLCNVYNRFFHLFMRRTIYSRWMTHLRMCFCI